MKLSFDKSLKIIGSNFKNEIKFDCPGCKPDLHYHNIWMNHHGNILYKEIVNKFCKGIFN